MKVLALLTFILVCVNIKAQDYLMFWNAYQLFNPAIVGVQQKYNAALIGKEQWIGLTGAPLYGSILFNMKLNAIHGGAGISYTYCKIGYTHDNRVNLDYSYHINLGNNRILSLGLSGGINYQKTDVSNFIFPQDGSDPLLQINDKQFLFNYRFGAFYNSNHLELGVSSSHDNNWGSTLNNYLLIGSYRIGMGRYLDLTPRLIYTTNFEHNAYSAELIASLLKKFWMGGFYNFDDTYGFMAGVDIVHMIRIGAAYEQTVSMNKYTNGSVELVLALMLN